MKLRWLFRSLLPILIITTILSSSLPSAQLIAAPTLQADSDYPWIRQFGTTGEDRAVSIVFSPLGQIVVAGVTKDTLGAANQGGLDIWVTAFTTMGQQLWLTQIGGPQDDNITAIAVDSNGQIFVVGDTKGQMYPDMPSATGGIVVALDSNGHELWHAYEADNPFFAVAADDQGVYATGGTILRETDHTNASQNRATVFAFNRQGAFRWKAEFAEAAFSIGTAIEWIDGDLVVVGGATSGSEAPFQSMIWMAKLDLEGSISYFGEKSLQTTHHLALPTGICHDASSESHLIVGSAIDLNDMEQSIGWQAQVQVWDDDSVHLAVLEFRTGADQEYIAGAATQGLHGCLLSGNQSVFSDPASSFSLASDVWIAGMTFASTHWITSFGTSSEDTVTRPILGPDGKLYVAGSTKGDFGGANLGGFDVWLMKVELDALGMPTFAPSLPLNTTQLSSGEAPYSEYETLAGAIVFAGNHETDSITQRILASPHQLYAVQPDGFGLAQITRNGINPWKAAAIAPNGTTIVLSSLDTSPIRFIDPTGKIDFTVDHPGKRAHPLDWSPNGDSILFMVVESVGATDEDQDLWKLSYPALEWTQITSEDEIEDWDASWSPDGQQIAVERSNQLWMMNADGTGLKQISDQMIRFLDWSPDGKTIAYQALSSPERPEEWDIWLINPDGSNPRNLTNDPDWFEENPAWSPDSRFIVYNAVPSLQELSRIFILDTHTGEKSLLVENGNNLDPIWVSGAPNTPSDSASRSTMQRLSMQSLGFLFDSALWTIQADGSRLRKLTEPDVIGHVSAFAWSTDGTSVALIARMPDAAPKLLKLDMNDGSFHTILEEVEDGKIAWSGAKIVLMSRNLIPNDSQGNAWENQLTIFDLAAQPLAQRTIRNNWFMAATEGAPYSYVTVSEDGEWILFVDSGVKGIAAMNGAIAEIPTDLNIMTFPQWAGDQSRITFTAYDRASADQGSHAFQLDPQTGVTTSLLSVPANHVRLSGDGRLAAIADPLLKRISIGSKRVTLLTVDRAINPLWSPLNDAVVYRRTVYDPEIIGQPKMAPAWESQVSVNLVSVDGQYHRLLLSTNAQDLAWRPLVEGEWLQVDPPLHYKDHTHTLSYRTTNPTLQQDPWLLFDAFRTDVGALEAFGITDVQLLRDGEPIANADEIRQILNLYVAAYLLYRNTPEFYTDLDTIGEELATILANPVSYLGPGLETIFESEDARMRQAVRAIFTQPIPSEEAKNLARQISRELAKGGAIGDAFLDAAKFSQSAFAQEIAMRIAGPLQEWKLTGQTLTIKGHKTAWPASGLLDLAMLLVEIATIPTLSEENLSLLQLYQSSFHEGPHALNEKHARAAIDVNQELASSMEARLDLLEQFVMEKGADLAHMTGPALFSSFGAWAAQKLGAQSVSTFMLGHIGEITAGVGLGLSIGTFTMGLDQLYDHFTIASDANELRKLFQNTRISISEQAQHDDSVYDAELAAQHLIALRLEALSGAQVRSSYVDGVTATVQKGVLSPIYLKNLISGVDWEKEAQQYQEDTRRQLADFDHSFIHRPSLEPLAQMIIAHANLVSALSDSVQQQIEGLTPDTSLESTTDPVVGVVNADPLNLRAEPSTNATVLGQLTAGTPLIVIGQSADSQWLHVRIGNEQQGWVSAHYVNIIDESGPTSDVPAISDSSTSEVPICLVETHAQLNSRWNRDHLGCPIGRARYVWSAWQPFEGGAIMWREDTKRIYTLGLNGSWQATADVWAGSTMQGSRGTPPPERFAPDRGIGFVWERDEQIFTQLGWALDRERGTCTILQEFENGEMLRSVGPGCANGLYSHGQEPGFDLQYLVLFGAGNYTR